MIARTQSARCHLEYLAKGYGSTKRLPLEQLTGVLETSGSLIIVASMQSHWLGSSIGYVLLCHASSVTCQRFGG